MEKAPEKELVLNILLIEDNRDFSDLLILTFDSMNVRHNIKVVTTGEEALELIKAPGGSFDIIVADYLLPGIDGIELLNQFRSEGIDIPTVFLTGQGSEQIAVKALKMGASDYLVKEVSSFQILPTVLERVYRRKQIEKHNLELQKKIVQQNKELAETNQNLMLSSKELIKAERMASLLFFVRGISHELNNPLAGIVGFSELLLNKVDPKDPAREDLEEIRSCAYRVKDIVSKLAKFCGREKQRERLVNAHELIDEVLEFFLPQAEEAGIHVEKKFLCVDPMVKVTAVDIQQAFMAILINAREAMSAGGKLTIATNIFDDTLEISIGDTGVGIEEENLEKIFSPFFSTNKGEKVMGMGLAVTYGIVKENNGEINVRSRPGEGTTFTISLPLAK